MSSKILNHLLNPWRFPAFLGIILFTILAALIVQPAHSAPPEPEGPTPTPFIDPRMEKPVIPVNPSLAERGSVVYWSICMACHGEQGQGLTDEFRAAAFGEDMNCWTSKCHGKNHPPEGFEFPRIVPPVAGDGTLRQFVTAAELQGYLLEKMPWWKPGSLSLDESWALTAHMLRRNGALPADAEFNIKEAAVVPVHLPFVSHRAERSGQWILIITLGALVLTLAIGSRLKNAPLTAANGKGAARPNFMHHLHPPTIPLPQARWRYTLGAGGLAIFLSLVLILTGILEMFFYVPTPEQAGPSIQVITFLVPFGGLVRGIHFWAAQALVIVAIIHLLRVIFTGAFSRPRRFNYLLGLGLLLLILFFDFTGYVLRWDEGIRWALTVGTNLLKTIPLIGDQVYGFVIGGDQPGLATLTRFYAWHIFALTAIMLTFVVWHIFRVRRDGGIAAPPPEGRPDIRRITRYELVRREVLAMLVACLALILVATLLPTPLAVPIQENAITSPSDVRAPWFFLWVQYLLRFGDAFWFGVGIPLVILVIFAVLPYIFPALPTNQQGRWFAPDGRAVQIIAASLALAVLVLTALELLH